MTRTIEREIRMICCALLHMRNLVSLELGFLFPWETLKRYDFKLEQFVCCAFQVPSVDDPRGFGTNFRTPSLNDTLGFLFTQPQLEIFEWRPLVRTIPKGFRSPSLLPTLHRLIGPPKLFSSILINHTISDVTLSETPQLREMTWMSDVTGTIECLTMKVPHNGSRIPQLVTCFPVPSTVSSVKAIILMAATDCMSGPHFLLKLVLLFP